jgi:hypothetical protein
MRGHWEEFSEMRNSECGIKKLNRRGRGARRGKNGPKLETQHARGITSPLSTLSGRSKKRPIVFRKAPLRSLPPPQLSSCPDSWSIMRKKDFDFPKREKNRKPQRAGRTQRGSNIHRMVFVFSLREENTLRSLRALRFDSFLHPRRIRRFL